MAEIDTASSPDEASRASPLRGLSEFLASSRDAAIEQWVLAVRRDEQIETADRLTHEQLLDHLPELYVQLCAYLQRRDPSILTEDIQPDAEEHGEVRWKDGYQIDELVRELAALRHVLAGYIGRYRGHDARFDGTAEANATALLHQFFTEVTVTSIEQFTRESEARLKAHVDQLEEVNRALESSRTGLTRAQAERGRLAALVAQELQHVLMLLSKPDGAPTPSVVTADWTPGLPLTLVEARNTLRRVLEDATFFLDDSGPERVRIDLAQLHKDVAGEFAAEMQRKALVFDGDRTAAPRSVLGDPQRTIRIARALLAHAIRAASHGTVSLRFATVDEARWSIVTTWEAEGPDAEAAPLLPDTASGPAVPPPPAATTARQAPLLAIARDITATLGGSLNLVFKPAHGARLEAVLPRDIAAARAGEQAAQESEQQAGQQAGQHGEKAE